MRYDVHGNYGTKLQEVKRMTVVNINGKLSRVGKNSKLTGEDVPTVRCRGHDRKRYITSW